MPEGHIAPLEDPRLRTRAIPQSGMGMHGVARLMSGVCDSAHGDVTEGRGAAVNLSQLAILADGDEGIRNPRLSPGAPRASPKGWGCPRGDGDVSAILGICVRLNMDPGTPDPALVRSPRVFLTEVGRPTARGSVPQRSNMSDVSSFCFFCRGSVRTICGR